MKKYDFIRSLKKRTNINIPELEQIVDAFLDTIVEGLQTDGKVEFINFFELYVQHREPRTARNPKTDEKIFAPARNVLKFKPRPKLKDLIQ